MIQHIIDVERHAPLLRRSCQSPECLEFKVEKEIKQMLALGIIEPSYSPWCSPIVLFKKPSKQTQKLGERHFCIDFRKLNAGSKFDNFPMPWIDDVLDLLDSAKYSPLDLAKGYWQVPLEKESKYKAIFTISQRLYQFKMLLFCLYGTLATLQCLVDRLLWL